MLYHKVLLHFVAFSYVIFYDLFGNVVCNVGGSVIKCVLTFTLVSEIREAIHMASVVWIKLLELTPLIIEKMC